MTFRDDHDAALARAEALENEVERERERADGQAAEAAKLRRQRDELEERLERLEQGKAKPLSKPVPVDEPVTLSRPYKSADGEREMLLIALAIVGLFLLIAIMAMNR